MPICGIIDITVGGRTLERGSHNRRRNLQEQMHKLMRLIQGGKFSKEKRIVLEQQYCYLQRDLNIIDAYQKMRNKNQKSR